MGRVGGREAVAILRISVAASVIEVSRSRQVLAAQCNHPTAGVQRVAERWLCGGRQPSGVLRLCKGCGVRHRGGRIRADG